MGFGLDLGGILGFSKEKSKGEEVRDIEHYYPKQKELLFGLIDWVKPKVGEGATPYTGTLPGTSGPSALQTKAFEELKGLEFGGPEDWRNRVKSFLKSRREYLAPAWEEEEALLGEKMRTMGLRFSSDMVKELLDLKKTRTAEESLIGQEKYDAYERFATMELPQVMMEAGEIQRQIEEAGVTAHFEEWLRTQPEYSPYMDIMLSLLKLTPVQKGTIESKGSTSALGFKTGDIGFSFES